MSLDISKIWRNSNPKKYLIPSAIGFCLLTLVLIWLSYNGSLDQVSLTVDGKIFKYKTIKSTVAGVLEEKGIKIKQGDVVVPELKSKIIDNLHIKVVRAFPVTIKWFNKISEINTVEKPVREVLAQAKIAYDEDDKVKPGLDQMVSSGEQIEIIKVTSKNITTHEAIPSGVEYRPDSRLGKGTRKVVRIGQDGMVERQEKVVYENGREQRRIKLGEKMIKPRINAIIALGIKPIVKILQTSRGSYRYLEVKNMDASAYSPGPESCGIYAKYGRTYSGKKAGFGIVAVDRRVIPLGTKLYIEGYGKAEAGDIGAAIKGNRIDLCFETYREAIMYGRKKVNVYILTD